jgi:CubicO group peptidase (beta-lactamase class C family)
MAIVWCTRPVACGRWFVVLALAALVPAGATELDADSAQRIDAIFAPWNSARTPGCALAVTRRGQIEFERGYGAANLETGAWITPQTVFDIGSVSKQFTAMSVVLLALDGRLSLDDEIHRYVPELPKYGAPITLRQMLHHLSGLRSYSDLFDLAGVPEENWTNDEDALALIARQRGLNFPPGRQYLYSDTNYFLLSLVVKRVAGRSLRDFAQERIFTPLGMSSTQFNDNHRRIVANRATGYAPADGGGFEIDMSNFEQLGDGAVLTTVEDLARWERNFTEPTVGGPRAIELLQERGVRAGAGPVPYAMGLIRDRYRGLERVQHTGEWVGYRSSLLRFPESETGVVVLCNQVGEVDPFELSERVADVVLKLPAPEAPPLAHPETLAGVYANAEQFALMRFAVQGGALAFDDDGTARPLRAVGERVFELGNSATRFEFHTASNGGMEVHAYSDDFDPMVLRRQPSSAAAAAAPPDAAGTYWSDDLGTAWQIAVRGTQLVRRQPRYPEQTLDAIAPNVYQGALSEGSYRLRFTFDASKHVTGFDVASNTLRPLHFVRRAGAKP